VVVDVKRLLVMTNMPVSNISLLYGTLDYLQGPLSFIPSRVFGLHVPNFLYYGLKQLSMIKTYMTSGLQAPLFSLTFHSRKMCAFPSVVFLKG